MNLDPTKEVGLSILINTCIFPELMSSTLKKLDFINAFINEGN